ncbi:MAG: hypothetical protein DRI89_07375 [Bacteroidetes bacterium]|nr:MAG: hypothetical protein DRI89_07375 [Bacteroidota bacterium]
MVAKDDPTGHKEANPPGFFIPVGLKYLSTKRKGLLSLILLKLKYETVTSRSGLQIQTSR